jgi:phospholipid/cholesterol/gamma-HCH transport system substrate-binding protein
MTQPLTSVAAARRPRRALRWGALVAAGAVLLAGCKFDGAYDLPLPGSPVDADHSIEVTAEFLDILNVVPRSPVMVDDVTVGEVTQVDRVGWHAKVTLRVRDDVELPDNAIADIRQVSLLGEKYVALEPPAEGASEDPLEDGDNIGLPRTGRNPEVEEVLGALSYLLSGGGVAQLGTITHELNNAMSGRENRLRSLLHSLDSVIGTLDEQKGDIINALESVNSLTKTLNAEKPTITGALDVMGPAVKVLADQHDELIGMLRALDRLGVVGTRVIRASKADLIKTLAHLRPVLSQLHAAGDKLAPGLNLLISFPFPKEASEIVKGDYANTSIRAEISLTNFLPEGAGLPDLPIPDVPLPDIPNPGVVLSDVKKCLNSGNINSKACKKVLADLDSYKNLKKKCKTKKYKNNPVCQFVHQLPDGPGLPDLPNVPLPTIPDLPDLLGRYTSSLPDASLAGSLASGAASSQVDMRTLYGGGQA